MRTGRGSSSSENRLCGQGGSGNTGMARPVIVSQGLVLHVGYKSQFGLADVADLSLLTRIDGKEAWFGRTFDWCAFGPVFPMVAGVVIAPLAHVLPTLLCVHPFSPFLGRGKTYLRIVRYRSACADSRRGYIPLCRDDPRNRHMLGLSASGRCTISEACGTSSSPL
jgi:hypothetical protein